uniref:Uncharacterized protein n=1 Tax=Oryza barthii TaxID=65489 RepID=A0A0D3EMJ0_9ORYZ
MGGGSGGDGDLGRESGERGRTGRQSTAMELGSTRVRRMKRRQYGGEGESSATCDTSRGSWGKCTRYPPAR